MRFIFEHPWVASVLVSSIGIGFLWVGLRENLIGRVKIGVCVLGISFAVLIIGILVETPTEHAKSVIYGFVEAVVDGNVESATHFLTENVILVDQWEEVGGTGKNAVRESIIELHERHTIRYNAIMNFQPFEREGDVLVELTILSRVSGIGTVPSRWRVLVRDDETAWRIYSIDAIEIMGRSFR